MAHQRRHRRELFELLPLVAHDQHLGVLRERRRDRALDHVLALIERASVSRAGAAVELGDDVICNVGRLSSAR